MKSIFTITSAVLLAAALTLSLVAPLCASAQDLQPARSLAAAIDAGAWSRPASELPPDQQPALPPAPAAPDSRRFRIAIYPVLVWVPVYGASVDVPSGPDTPGGPDLPGGSGSTPLSLNGAALVGLSVAKDRWRVDTEGIWAALTTSRDRPLVNVDLDIIYGYVSGGVRVYKDLYVTGGVRRLALKYGVTLGERPEFSRKPGLWDPLIGLGWHGELGPKWELHIFGDGGGFGVGADVDLVATARADWKFTRHVGLTFGYSGMYLKISDTVLNRTFKAQQSVSGPILGFGLYF